MALDGHPSGVDRSRPYPLRPRWLVTELPDALVATFALVDADGLVTALNVWDSAEAVAHSYAERVHALVQAEVEPPNKSKRHGERLVASVRR